MIRQNSERPINLNEKDDEEGDKDVFLMRLVKLKRRMSLSAKMLTSKRRRKSSMNSTKASRLLISQFLRR